MSSAQPPATAPAGSRKEVNLSLRAFIGLLGFVVLPWVLMALSVLPIPQWHWLKRDSATEIRAGPWGRLEIVDIAISPIDILVPGTPDQPLPTTWVFENYGPEELKDWIQSLDLTDAQRVDLLNTNAWIVAANGVTLHPAGETVLGLTPAARLGLYEVLGSCSRNEGYFQPWSMKAALFEDRLAHAGLAAETQQLVRRLAYSKGTRMFFSDVPVILNRLANMEDKRRVMRFLNSASTYLVHLEVSPEADTEAIAAYWGLRGRRKDLKPILESLTRLPRGGKLDIAHVLPAFARQRLYIYPSPVLAQDGVRRDCHWTSLNFFSLVPDDRFGDSEEATRHILADFYQIGEQPQYGDLALFLLPSGDAIHSAVVLAGNLAFTKNGENLDQPWIIMDIDELRELYGFYYHTTLGVQFWRQK
jgi:hypothetical protein